MQGQYLPPNCVATLTASADTIGSYSLFGVQPSGYTEVTAGSTVTIGPFDSEKYYTIQNLSFSYTPSIAANAALKSPIASPTFTGTQTLPKPSVSKINGTEASNAVTASGSSGVITTSALTTAAGGTYDITWTNTSIVATSVVLLSVQGGTNTRQIDLKVVPGSGSATLSIQNIDLVNALNGTVLIGYLVV